MSGFQRPGVLVLGGGGVLGEAWMTAVLAGLADAAGFDARECDAFVGTSAGSIVAAVLAAGIEPGTRLGELPEQPAIPTGPAGGDGGLSGRAMEIALGAGRTAAAPLAVLGLRSTQASGALLRRAVLGRVPQGRRSLAGLGGELERAGAGWDGRLSVAAVDVASGRRVMFGTTGAPHVPVGTAVEASCAIPGVFRPVTVDGRSYVDGGVWSPTNLDAAPAGRGTRVLCLNPTGSMRTSLATPFGAFGPLSRSLAAVEALAVQRRGARVLTVSPDAASVAAIGGNLMDPRPRSRVIAAGVAQGRALGRGG
jgi:NTE family protein